MSRSTSVVVSFLNIKMHPHSSQSYYDLFMEAARSKKIVKLKGDQVAVIDHITKIDSQRPLEGIYGTFSKYVFVDPKGDWYNTLKDDNATDDDIKQIRIPDHLKYRLSKFHFVFFPKSHRLAFEAKYLNKSISPNVVSLFFCELLNSPKLQDKYSEIEVVIEQSRDKLKQIFKIPLLNTLDIFITRPNPGDDGAEEEEEVMRRMEAQNLSSLYVQNKSMKGQTIIPDRETELYARVAVSNGYVEAKGKDAENVTVHEKTTDHPFFDAYRYNRNSENFLDKFLLKAKNAISSLL